MAAVPPATMRRRALAFHQSPRRASHTEYYIARAVFIAIFDCRLAIIDDKTELFARNF